MKILIIGGFLGSGKTSIINRLIQDISKEGHLTAVIQNEAGEIGLDQSFSGNSSTGRTALSGGCVCCELFGNLLDSIETIREQIEPDWLIIEASGLASLDSIQKNFEEFGSRSDEYYYIAVADCERFEVFWEVITPLIKGQLSAADIVLLTKNDIRAPSSKMKAVIFETAPDAQIIDSFKTKLWSAVKAALSKKAPHIGSR